MRPEQAELLATLWHQRTVTGTGDEHGLYEQMLDFLTTVVPDTEFAAVVPRTAPRATHHQALYSHEILALGEEAVFRIQGDGNPAPEPGRSEFTLNASAVRLSGFGSPQIIWERIQDGDTARHVRSWHFRSGGSGHPVISITVHEGVGDGFAGDEARLAVELARRLGWH